jgi:hypothetical protein
LVGLGSAPVGLGPTPVGLSKRSLLHEGHDLLMQFVQMRLGQFAVEHLRMQWGSKLLNLINSSRFLSGFLL